MKNKIIKTEHLKTNGVTIIETMIAVSLFLIIITTGMGSLLNANLIYNKSRDMRTIIDSLNFVAEDMSRSVRTGHSYRCLFGTGSDIFSNISSPRSCVGGWGIAFESDLGSASIDIDQWVYYIDNLGRLFKSTDGATSFVQLTPDEVVLDSASLFAVLGAESPTGPNRQQPLVSIKLVGNIQFKNINTPFSLQTSMSQRLLDI